MATRTITLSGPLRWAKVFEENKDMNGFEGAYREHEGGYTIEIGLTEEEFKRLKDIGSAKQGKVEEDGLRWVKVLRKHKDRFESAGGPPEVVNATGEKMSYVEDGPIGNGSEGEVTVQVYDTAYRNGTRLTKVQVNRMVESPSSVA